MAEARQPVEKPKTAWDRFIKKHAFLYAAVLTALATTVVTALIANVPKTVESVFSGGDPKISVEDDSMSLTDLSIVYADKIDRPTGGMSADLPRGGVKAGHTRTKIVVYNSTGAAIRITDLRARITKRSAPLSGALVARTSQGATSEIMGIGLWQDPPIARTLGRKHELGSEAFFAVQSIDIGKEQTQVIEVTAFPDEHYYEYDIDISYHRGGEQKTVVAQDDSMRVSGYAATYRSAFTPTGERYEPMSAEEVASWSSSHQADS
ncbi:hypothetical protein [Micromonospora sp. NPDC005171]|uniref:hypothetical protein n=1 Tax=Micromonospora sp. NPDC005171 TaxID=3156866 RepID=UPI0033A4CE35